MRAVGGRAQEHNSVKPHLSLIPQPDFGGTPLHLVSHHTLSPALVALQQQAAHGITDANGTAFTSGVDCAAGQTVMVEGGGYVCAWTQCPKPPANHDGLAVAVIFLGFIAAYLISEYGSRP
jgi:hypothetical protein